MRRRDGSQQLPPGQYLTDDFPVLSAGPTPRIPLETWLLAKRVRFIRTEISGFDLADRQLLTEVGPISWRRLVLALGSRPNDFAIPRLAQRALSLYSASDAERV